ncbi:MAG: NUDIX hydrolase [Candidatus Chromulinivorax sp.]
MYKEQLRQLLQNYEPTAEEQSYKERMLAFLDEQDDCFERELACGHFTASAWLVSRDLSKVLLMHHAKLGIWVQLGGHADGDSDLLEVAIREAQEESGILDIEPITTQIFDIDIHTIPAKGLEPAHEHFDVRFLLRVASDEQPVKNAESKELVWFGQDSSKLPTVERSVVRMFEKWQELFGM